MSIPILSAILTLATPHVVPHHHHPTDLVMHPVTTTTTSSSTSTSTTTTLDYDHRWDRVAVCEEGGWVGYSGDAYPDSLGISRSNWYAYGGGDDLRPATQVAVAQRIEAAAGLAGYVPDQGYCDSW